MRRWVVVCLLAVGVIIAYIDRTNLSIALASPDFKAFFQLTDTRAPRFSAGTSLSRPR